MNIFWRKANMFYISEIKTKFADHKRVTDHFINKKILAIFHQK